MSLRWISDCLRGGPPSPKLKRELRPAPTGDRLDALLRRSPFQRAAFAFSTRRLAIIAYHDVKDEVAFGRQLDLLQSEFHPVSLGDVVEAFEHSKPLPHRSVLITFDDGDRSVFDLARPLLRQRDIPAVVFVVPSVLDTDQLPWPQEVRALLRTATSPALDPDNILRRMKQLPNHVREEVVKALRERSEARPRQPQLRAAELEVLASEGIAVGNHSFGHACLDRCTDDELGKEVSLAHQMLAETLDQQPVAFAYPDGAADARARTVLHGLGYKAAFLFDHRMADPTRGDRYLVSRLRVNADASPDRVRIILSGLHPFLLRARNRIRIPHEHPQEPDLLDELVRETAT